MATPVEGSSMNSTTKHKTLSCVFKLVGDQMTSIDVAVLKFLYTKIMNDELISNVTDGYSFLVALEKMGRVDETNFKHILHLLRTITRHDLTHLVNLRKRKTVELDPVDVYLIETEHKQKNNSNVSNVEKDSNSNLDRTFSTSDNKPSTSHRKRQRKSCSTTKVKSSRTDNHLKSVDEELEMKKKETCDIKLRVRAEYCQHENALDGNIFSNKPELLERQFEKFAQANTILKSRDLGSIVCDIKFSELTYLDAFWRDYINGSLLEALKGVFITDTLKQAVGHEAIKLLVNVDEDDYEAGRLKLLANLTV
ncbi:hypothetical protein SNE40_023560 [Patella caerulea]|uniref:DED domain-containing protein n=2 Tax=Patella caerulea TaxID=87958 RepID=A0AAN8GAE4_PATCE